MNLNDIISLAKQGYKPADIKELIALADTNEQVNTTVATSAEVPVEPQPIIVDQNADSVNATEQPIDVKKPEIDYKSMYEQSQKTIAEIQKANLSKDISGAKQDDQTALNDIVASFM